MTEPKHAFGGKMPGMEGMGPARTGIMIVVIAILAIVAVGAMVKGMDSAHGGVVVETPQR